MKGNWVAVIVVLTASVAHASQKPEQLPNANPTTTQAPEQLQQPMPNTPATSTPTPVPNAVGVPGPAHAAPVCTSCIGCRQHGLGQQLWEFFTYRPCKLGTGCKCKCCDCCYRPPLFMYFLCPACVEGSGHCAADCGCATGHRFMPLASGFGFGLGGCSTCH